MFINVACFLSPLLLLTGWADLRVSLGVSAGFILVNSAAGMLGHIASLRSLPSAILLWALAAAAGAIIGSELAIRRLADVILRRLLALVLGIAGVKLLLAR